MFVLVFLDFSLRYRTNVKNFTQAVGSVYVAPINCKVAVSTCLLALFHLSNGVFWAHFIYLNLLYIYDNQKLSKENNKNIFKHEHS